MASVESIRDELRATECEIRDLEFCEMTGEDVRSRINRCMAKAERLRSDSMVALGYDPECPISVQVALILRYSERKNMGNEPCAMGWIPEFSAEFRKIWNRKIRDLDSIERQLYRKMG